jgi:hypothetical protein
MRNLLKSLFAGSNNVRSTSSMKENASMIRSSRLGQLALGFLALLAGSVSLPAADIYVTIYSGSSQRFGVIPITTGAYQDLNSNVAGNFIPAKGLAWNPISSLFNFTYATSSNLNTISQTGTLGNSISTTLPDNGATTIYDSSSSKMLAFSFNAYGTLNTATGAYTNIGVTGRGSAKNLAFVGGTLYGTFSPNNPGSSSFGSFNTTTGVFTAIGSAGSSPTSLALASDGVTLYGLSKTTIFTIDPSTGDTTSLISITNVPPTNGIDSAGMIASVPEPSTYALGAIATGVMAAVARRRKARKA